MKLKHAAVLTAVALLSACGGKLDGVVVSLGFTPVTANQKDNRTFQTFCPGCKKPTEVDTAKCKDKKCATVINWSATYRCTVCQGSGVCNACTLMEQTRGECYNCKGQGVLIYAGQSPVCPNCKGEKKCPTCKGTRKCDGCVDGKVAKDVVKSKAAKFVGGDSENELPPSDARPPDAPKPEEKKDDAPKPEEKKDGAAEEKK